MSKNIILGVVAASLAASTALAQTSLAATSTLAPMTATIPTAPKVVTVPLADNAAQPTAPATGTAPAAQPDNSATTTTGANTDTSNTMNSSSTAATTSTMNAPAGSWSATKLIGKSVKNRANETIGEIADLVVNSDGKIGAVVIGVGGFLGMGEKRVAVPFDKLQTASLASGAVGTFVVMDMTKDALTAAPEYKPATQPSN